MALKLQECSQTITCDAGARMMERNGICNLLIGFGALERVLVFMLAHMPLGTMFRVAHVQLSYANYLLVNA